MKINRIYKASKPIIMMACIASIVYGCKKKDPDLNLVLAQSFHGSYQIVAAEAQLALDIDQDGVANTSLLKEIPVLKKLPLELLIKTSTGAYGFAQYWPSQYFLTGEIPTQFDPQAKFDYVEKATVASMDFSPDFRKINLSRTHTDVNFPLPTSVNILGNKNIEIQMVKTIYTTKGWQTVTINAVYQKISDSI